LTDFGHVAIGSIEKNQYFILNTGTSALTLESPIFTGPFSLVGGFPTVVQQGQFIQFSVGLDTSAAGVYSGSISFANNDSARNPYNFALAATVVPDSLVLHVIDNGYTIHDNPYGPQPWDHSDLGRAVMGTTQERTFVIKNDGAVPISLSPPTFTGPFSLS